MKARQWFDPDITLFQIRGQSLRIPSSTQITLSVPYTYYLRIIQDNLILSYDKGIRDDRKSLVKIENEEEIFNFSQRPDTG